MTYTHTQTSPLDSLLLAAFAVLLGSALMLDSEPAVYYSLLLASSAALAAAGCFGRLRVEGDRDGLSVRFGPIPLFRKYIPYQEIREVRKNRSSLLDGWGVHWIPGRGWTWNLWGFSCVELTTDRGPLRIGTDDSDNLAAFLRRKIARPNNPSNP